MSPVHICQNDKPMTSLALSTAHKVKTNLCQPHSLKGCHIFVINLSKTCHSQFLFYAVDGNESIYHVKLQILSKELVQNIYISSVLKARSQFAVRFMKFHEKDSSAQNTF